MKWRAPVFGILVMAVLLVNAAPAAATHTVFCVVNTSVCPSPFQYPTETSFSSEVGPTGTYAEFEMAGQTPISCTAGELAGPVIKHAEGPMTGEVEPLLHFSSCEPAGCFIDKNLKGGGVWEWSAKGGGNGDVELSGFVPVSCGELFCSYALVEAKAEFEAASEEGEKPFVSLEEGRLIRSGFSCPLEAKLRFRTQVTKPATTPEISPYVTN